MQDELGAKRLEIIGRMKALTKKLEAGDDSELLAWVLPNRLSCAQRPLRHHPRYSGSGVVLPAALTPFVFEWVAKIRAAGIVSIISFMHDRDRACYTELDLGASDVLSFYEAQGLSVVRLPWEDPHHSKADAKIKRRKLEACRVRALAAFDELPKPVLLQCSAGIDRSAPVQRTFGRIAETRKGAVSHHVPPTGNRRFVQCGSLATGR
jgi:hypothetical protein